jgi:hypothetical protein
MRFLLAAILVLVASGPAVAQSKGKDYRSLIEVGADENGRIAHSGRAAEAKETTGYSPGAEVITVFWVEARKPENGPAQVSLVGRRIRYVLPDEVPKTTEFGPWDPAEPVSVGSPWQDADLRYRGASYKCLSDAHWCWQSRFIEVVLPESLVRSVVTNPKMKEVRLSLSNRRKVEWRTPRDELIATLNALGVLNEFSEPAK